MEKQAIFEFNWNFNEKKDDGHVPQVIRTVLIEILMKARRAAPPIKNLPAN